MKYNIKDFILVAKGIESKGKLAFSSQVNSQRKQIQEYIMNKYHCTREVADYLLGRATQSPEVAVKIMQEIERLDTESELY